MPSHSHPHAPTSHKCCWLGCGVGGRPLTCSFSPKLGAGGPAEREERQKSVGASFPSAKSTAFNTAHKQVQHLLRTANSFDSDGV